MMKRPTTLAALVLLACASGALAKSSTGTIESVDKKHDSITLADGTKLNLPEGIEAESLEPGEKVVVTYTTKNGKMTVSDIHQAK